MNDARKAHAAAGVVTPPPNNVAGLDAPPPAISRIFPFAAGVNSSETFNPGDGLILY
jgi:hypothetical protein